MLDHTTHGSLAWAIEETLAGRPCTHPICGVLRVEHNAPPAGDLIQWERNLYSARISGWRHVEPELRCPRCGYALNVFGNGGGAAPWYVDDCGVALTYAYFGTDANPPADMICPECKRAAETSSPTDPEIEAIRVIDEAERDTTYTMLADLSTDNARWLAREADELAKHRTTLLLAYDRACREREETKDCERELLFTERNLLSRLERAVAAQDKGDALRAALDDEELLASIAHCPDHKPQEDEQCYDCEQAWAMVDAYRAKLREVAEGKR